MANIGEKGKFDKRLNMQHVRDIDGQIAEKMVRAMGYEPVYRADGPMQQLFVRPASAPVSEEDAAFSIDRMIAGSIKDGYGLKEYTERNVMARELAELYGKTLSTYMGTALRMDEDGYGGVRVEDAFGDFNLMSTTRDFGREFYARARLGMQKLVGTSPERMGECATAFYDHINKCINGEVRNHRDAAIDERIFHDVFEDYPSVHAPTVTGEGAVTAAMSAEARKVGPGPAEPGVNIGELRRGRYQLLYGMLADVGVKVDLDVQNLHAFRDLKPFSASDIESGAFEKFAVEDVVASQRTGDDFRELGSAVGTIMANCVHYEAGLDADAKPVLTPIDAGTVRKLVPLVEKIEAALADKPVAIQEAFKDGLDKPGMYGDAHTVNKDGLGRVRYDLVLEATKEKEKTVARSVDGQNKPKQEAVAPRSGRVPGRTPIPDYVGPQGDGDSMERDADGVGFGE